MKKFSNLYIFIFSAVMVTVVAALLSVVAMKLKPFQEKNIKLEAMQNILTSVQVENNKKNAESLFNKYITDSYVINTDGKKLGGVTAFNVDMKKEVAKIDEIKKLENLVRERRVSPFKNYISGFIHFKTADKQSVKSQVGKVNSNRQLPVFICEKEGNTYYIVPLRGKGLWGPIWGYMSFENDLNTVYGAVFDHKSETPGLGAEIKESWFQENFRGKKIFKDGEFKSIEVAKGGADDTDQYAVDAISGGTITSKGLESMIHDCLKSYSTYFETLRN
ncbi:MAG: NADH:ubiquinone reductase (Na(+)-transporting) subunit C [Bacteroidales bacterium]|nr:NADH:ubiquinone reductase (Na(+)-transporting) subunit C [Bacteroidales bacterium]